MTLLVIALVVGVAVRRLTGATDPLPVLPWPAVPIVAVGLQILNQVAGLGWTSLTVASHALVTLWAVAMVARQPSAARLGTAVVAVGFVLNLVPVSLNGRMPVSASAAEAVGFELDESIETGNLAKHRIARDDDHLMVLADTIPLVWFRAVVSPGDLVMALGAVLALRPVTATRRHEPAAPIVTDKPSVAQ